MIRVRNLTKRYGPLTAVDSLTLEIGAGEVFGFIGPNGAGKSTTMKILAGLARPDAGQAEVDGLDVSRHAKRVRARIGYMPDFLGVYEDLSVDEYLQFFASAYKTDRARRRAVIDSVLELTDLSDKKRALVDSLSRGMQQRLGVARVLLHEPRVLLLDEPASGLDPRARIEMRSLLTELGRMGKCIMVSSHILSELGEMCTSIGIIERGTLLFAGSVDEALRHAHQHASDVETIDVALEPGGISPEAARAALLALPRVRRAEVRTPDSLVVELAREASIQAAPSDAQPTGAQPTRRHDVLDALVRAGARVGAFTPARPNLEDAFLRITKGRIQ